MRIKTLLTILFACTLVLGNCGGDNGTESGDTTSPSIQSFQIAGGEQYTTTQSVTLTISATDNVGVTEMRFSTNNSFTGADWITYQGSYSYQFQGSDGPVTLYAQVRDAAGNISSTTEDDVVVAVNSTVIYCNPNPLTIPSGGTGTITITVANALDMSSARFVLDFDSTKLEVTELTVDLPSNHILKSTGAALVVSDQEYDNDAGRIIIGALALQDGFTGVTGNGAFATIKFTAKTTLTSATQLVYEEQEVYNYPVANPPVAATNAYAVDGSIQ